MRSPLWKYSATAACLLAAMSVNAQADVCGDADNDGTVTVTDGVQALRAAASLSSSCTGNNRCDVDGNGSVTVTDGVNILRKAADLPFTGKCGGVDAQVQSLLSSTVPVVSIFGPLTKIGASSAQAADSQNLCINPEGQFLFNPDTGEITFVNCDFGGIVFDGTFAVSNNTVSFNLHLAAAGETLDFSGNLTTSLVGENVVLSGRLGLSSVDFGTVNVGLEDIVGDPSGKLIGGALVLETSTSGIEGVTSIRIGFTPSQIAPVSVTFADNSIANFNYDINNDVLTPVPAS
jgi:hypothetical protein